MRVISRKALREFSGAHPSARSPLDAWYRVAKAAVWRSLAEVRRTYPHADSVGHFTVFNIKGNSYRLITIINYASAIIYIREVLTHADYDREAWKIH